MLGDAGLGSTRNGDHPDAPPGEWSRLSAFSGAVPIHGLSLTSRDARTRVTAFRSLKGEPALALSDGCRSVQAEASAVILLLRRIKWTVRLT